MPELPRQSSGVDRLGLIERTQAEREAEAKELGFVAATNDITQAERRGYCRGWDAAVAHSKTIRGAVGIIETARQELRDAIKGGNPQVLREYAEDAVEAMSAFLDHPRGQSNVGCQVTVERSLVARIEELERDLALYERLAEENGTKAIEARERADAAERCLDVIA